METGAGGRMTDGGSFFSLLARALLRSRTQFPPVGAVQTALGCRRGGRPGPNSCAVRAGACTSPTLPQEPSEPQRSHLRDGCIGAEKRGEGADPASTLSDSAAHQPLPWTTHVDQHMAHVT